MENDELNFEELAYEVSILLEGTLYFAGVKKRNLQKATEIYIEVIDEVLESGDFNGVDEVIEVIEYMKLHHKELFV